MSNGSDPSCRFREGTVRIPSGCAIAAVVSEKGDYLPPGRIVSMLAVMRERSNGLGGGFAAYGIYGYDGFVLHAMCDDMVALRRLKSYLKPRFKVVSDEPLPTRPSPRVRNAPVLARFFGNPATGPDPEQAVASMTMEVNSTVPGAFIFSSGRDMGVFKASAFPEDVAEFFRLEEYTARIWTGHGRFPTNSPGWWGGAHPFALLDWSVVHNGELSSYGTNRRFVENSGYRVSLLTDTEVIVYVFDYLVRVKGMTLEKAAAVVAPPFWREIDAMGDGGREYARVRSVYGGALLNGPFSIVLANGDGVLALADRLALRPLVVGREGHLVYVASEEAAIAAVAGAGCGVSFPAGGEPVVVSTGKGRRDHAPERAAARSQASGGSR
ncbi:MAG: hypothetical protein HPY55_15050 [Firmicutes bacterium]|nr:hypothetical protein [Bacillota bacterium]